ncbi:6301_t:CDS:1 [Scutellospora calospora]|uniref:6301_t:CDS:1 n=1 Tax=Scutellospora calospora TaxID=85575 RepID=A0ACA9LVS9_9GLOM|nr:6301_t:CDS:1 [Scutellospora calospora]
MDIKIKGHYDFTNSLLNRTALRYTCDRNYFETSYDISSNSLNKSRNNFQDNSVKFFKFVIDETESPKKVFLKTWIDNWAEEKNIFNKTDKIRECKMCYALTFAKKYCEYCIRGYLARNYSKWTSGVDEIDKLIQKCQEKTIRPDYIVEWILFENFSKLVFKTSRSCANVYLTVWRSGQYDK